MSLSQSISSRLFLGCYDLSRQNILTLIIRARVGFQLDNKQMEEIKDAQRGKKDVRVSVFKDDMILYIKDPKESTRNLQQLISTFSKLAGYKISTQIK